jgi:hypothetical protein
MCAEVSEQLDDFLDFQMEGDDSKSVNTVVKSIAQR